MHANNPIPVYHAQARTLNRKKATRLLLKQANEQTDVKVKLVEPCLIPHLKDGELNAVFVEAVNEGGLGKRRSWSVNTAAVENHPIIYIQNMPRIGTYHPKIKILSSRKLFETSFLLWNTN